MDIDLQHVDRILEGYPARGEQLIQVLQDINSEYNYLPEPALRRVAEALGVPISKVYGVATFYNAFSLVPRGKHIVRVCQGTACHVRGAPLVMEELGRQLGVAPGETTEDMQFTLEGVNCVGACALGPVVIVDETYHGKMRQKDVAKILKRAKKQTAKD